MKITTTFLLLISVFFFLFASRANSQYLIFDPNYHYENLLAKQNDVKEMKIYDIGYELYRTDKYDIEGRLIEMYYSPDSYINFIYDNEGKLIKEIKVYGTVTYEHIYMYDSNNKLISYTDEEINNYLYYDDNNRLITVVGETEVSFKYDNNRIIEQSYIAESYDYATKCYCDYITEYYYDGDKLVQTIDKYKPVNSRNKYTERSNAKYTYYENGLIKEINDFRPRSGDYIISRFEYTYY